MAKGNKNPKPIVLSRKSAIDAEIARRLVMPYRYELFFEEGDWYARVVEFPGCMSDGPDPNEAIRMVRDAAEGWLQVSLEDGNPIPDPVDDDSYSGRFVVRLPQSLHRDAARRAEREGVSLNTYVVAAVARSLGQAR